MLRKYIDLRERRSYAADTNRTSLPFEWGGEFVGLQTNGTACESLRAFARDTVRSSERFYAYAATAAYSLNGELLKFPSAIETTFEENNTVWGRFFDAAGDLAVIVLPQWNCSWEGHVKLCRMLQQRGIASIRLSMPYHHFRIPAHLKRPEYMVSPVLGQTLQSARQAVLDARRTVDWLISRGYNKIAILGSSLGSCIAFLTFAHDERISAGVFIHVSGYFGDVVWRGLSTRHVRRSLEGFIEEEQLRDIWAPISPFPFIERLAHTKRRIQMFAGRYDPTFLPDLSQKAFDEFDRCSVPYDLHWMPCGHYTMAQLPFSAVLVHKVIQFLRCERDRS
jgi:hypothetical protein